MQFYRKTRRGLGGMFVKPLIKIFVFSLVFILIIFIVSQLDLPAPKKTIKQKIPNEKFKVIK
tara:strand:- start:461 stop:646 length:186 start_codon:yes stop_codon:yes gene_type:complete